MRPFLKELELQQKEGVFPGFIVGIFENQQWLEIEKGNRQVIPFSLPVGKEYYYDLASLTKPLTSLVLLQVLAEKKIDVTEKVWQYLPGFESEEVEIFHLLTHSAGLIGFIKNRNELTLEELKKALLKLTPQYPVGSQSVYSDHHYLLLGLLIETLTQQSLEENLEKYLNQKIGSHFTYYPPEERCVPTIPLYKNTGEFVMNLKGIPHDPKAQIFKRQAGHAGVFGRLEDLQKLTESLLMTPFPSEKIQQQLFSLASKNFDRSLGFKALTKKNGDFVYSHTGYTGTLLILDKITKKGLIFLCNRVHPIDERSAYILKRDEFIKLYLSEV